MHQTRRAPVTVVDLLRDVAASDADADAYVEYASLSAQNAPYGEKCAFGDMERVRLCLSFGALDAAADSVAALFFGAGVKKGDIVALLLPSSIDYAVCYQAALRLGAITSGVNPRLGPSERASIFERLRPLVTVVDDGHTALAPRMITRSEISKAIHEASAGKGVPAPPLPALDPADPVAVVWTGGSTGIPKGALFDHRNLEAVAAGTDVLSNPKDRRLSPLPFAHVGYMTRPWDEISNRIATIITPTPWRAADAISLMEREVVTVGQGVPTQWALVLAHPDFESADLSSLRVAGTGASRVPPELVRAMRERLGCPVVVRYTSTETSLGTGTRPGDPDEVVATTVGAPVAGVELELLDGEGYVVPMGEVGTVRMRSGAQMRGYVSHGAFIDRLATDAVKDSDGWITTGDLGRMGQDGNLRLVGRSTDMLIRGGYNVYPSEVEAVLGSHPAVGQVSVVGAPDPVLGEVVVAYVVPRTGRDAQMPTLEDLRAYCRASLADYKAPDRLELLSELPTTPLGKVDTRALREMAAKSDHETATRNRDTKPRHLRRANP
jgi:acyl-CoA synthetase (AMP-forming)/AMP-acid ligase II